MTEIKLYTELSSNLILIFLQLDLAFVHDFHSADEPCLFVLNKHDLTELPLSHLFANFKVRFFEYFRRT